MHKKEEERKTTHGIWKNIWNAFHSDQNSYENIYKLPQI